ncbi:MAG: VWA domain-containing protein [Acidobacteria bacterium]|nr:VWA domain-containing protein [Acidobacteriota bacterium]
MSRRLLISGLGMAAILALTIRGAAVAQAAGTIRGLVSDPSGRPVPSARIGLIDEASAVMRVTLTDTAGRFRFDGVPTERTFRAVATRFGYESASRQQVASGTDEVVLTLVPRVREPGDPSVETSVAAPASEESEPIQLGTKMVLLNVSVKDGGGRPVAGMNEANFAVAEDGAIQQIVFFEKRDAPISVVLVLDVSSSMDGESLREAKRAALDFVDQSHPRNELALIAFNDRVRIVRNFTSDRAQLVQPIRELTASGGTALHDAIGQAVELMAGAQHARHVIVVLSDGKDEDSARKFNQVERLVQASDVVVFAIGEYSKVERKLYLTGKKYYKDPPVEANLNPVWVLREVTELSGGSAYFPMAAEPLRGFFDTIARELQDQYVLGYLPEPRTGDPRFHEIEVTLKLPLPPGRFVIRTRKGYLN